MILDLGFVILLGLLVFGPKKTLEMSQTAGRFLAQFKVAGRELLQQIQDESSARRDDEPNDGPADAGRIRIS